MADFPSPPPGDAEVGPPGPPGGSPTAAAPPAPPPAELQTFASALTPSIQARLPLLAAPLAPGRLYETPVKHWPMEH